MNNNTTPHHTVTLSSGNKVLTCASGENLLTLLTENAILLRSDCGGKGVCGKCQVELDEGLEAGETIMACCHAVTRDLAIAIPASSLMSAHIIDKAEARMPLSFLQQQATAKDRQDGPGIAVDLGTTTIAVYLVERGSGTILASLAVKNPQALYGDDVVSRIGYIGTSSDRLSRLGHLVTGSIDWAVNALCESQRVKKDALSEMVVVGNPAMIHILQGVSPASIGVAPYLPQFSEARSVAAEQLGLPLPRLTVHTLPQISGFIGGDILAAAIATELDDQPEGTLLIDLGTNGELILRARNGFYATSCATGPAFEGATLSCGIQAIPGAIDRVRIDRDLRPAISTIGGDRKNGRQPVGICGSGVVSTIAEFLRKGIIGADGGFSHTLPAGLIADGPAGRRYPLHGLGRREVSISQKDIRNVQLGKAALISGMEFLLGAAKLAEPTKIIVAGAFGSHLEKEDLLTLGMLPKIDHTRIVIAGNAAGAGAAMALCSAHYRKSAEEIAARTRVINLAEDMAFQSLFIQRLSFSPGPGRKADQPIEE